MHKYIGIVIIAILIGLTACRKPTHFSDNESLKISFSTDTVTFDTVFTSIGSSTRQLMIYNNNNENLKIGSIRLEQGNQSQFSINVDGQSGYKFSDVEIYSKDSIYVFVRVTINPNDQNDCVMPLKSIEFNFPLYKGGKEVRKIFWETQSSVETLVCLSHKKADTKIEVALDIDANDIRDEIVDIENRVKSRENVKVTYKMIQQHIEKKYGFKVHTAYITEVKRELGLAHV